MAEFVNVVPVPPLPEPAAPQPSRLKRILSLFVERVPPMDPDAPITGPGCARGFGGCRGFGYSAFALGWIVEQAQARQSPDAEESFRSTPTS